MTGGCIRAYIGFGFISEIRATEPRNKKNIGQTSWPLEVITAGILVVVEVAIILR